MRLALVIVVSAVLWGCGDSSGAEQELAPLSDAEDPTVEPGPSSVESEDSAPLAAPGEAPEPGDDVLPPDGPLDEAQLLEPERELPGVEVEGGTGTACATGCTDLPVQDTAFRNRRAIEGCLTTCGFARLRPGAVYRIARPITVPSGALLTTRDATRSSAWAELRAVADTTSDIDPTHFGGNRMVTLCSKTAAATGCDSGSAVVGATLRFMRLNIDNRNKPNASAGSTVPGAVAVSMVLAMIGNDSLAEHVDLMNPLTRTTLPNCGATWGPRHRLSGISFSAPSKGNTLRHAKIHGLAHGVIFNATLTPAFENVVDDVEIFMNRSNAATFAGYGKIINSHFHHNGWCVGDLYQGGAIYCARNHHGGVVANSELHDTCRDVIDWDDCWNMRLTDNHIYNPGTRTYPAPVGNEGAVCNSAQTVRMGVPHGAVIAGNNIQNADRPWNTVGTHFGRDERRFSAATAAPFSDLPDGAAQSFAFLMVRRPDQRTLTAQGNDIRDNVFTANCNQPGTCVGMGYFTTRGTGLTASGAWTAQSTNAFRRNRYTASPKGSRRCGANWFAGSSYANGRSTCVLGSTANNCNSDDANHEGGDHGASHGSYRSCGCRSY